MSTAAPAATTGSLPSRRPPRGGRVLRRIGVHLLRLVVITFGILSLLFFLMRLSGDPAAVLAGPGSGPGRDRRGSATSWDWTGRWARSTWTSCGTWCTFDLGDSLINGRPALGLVLDRLPATGLLTRPPSPRCC